MFCKYCGRDIPETSEFCPVCGKKLKDESVSVNTEEERKPAGIVFALMLLALCGSTVMDWGRVLMFGYRLSIGLVITTVMLAAGLALLGRLIGQEKICTADYRLSDLLVLLCVWMVVPGLMFRWELHLVGYFLGVNAASAYWTVQTVIMPTIRLSAFWLTMGLIVLGLGRRGNWQPAKKQKLVLLMVLALCSVLGFLFAPQLAMVNDVPTEVVAMSAQTARVLSLFCWLWPLVILQAFHRLGTDKVGPVGAGAALVGMQLAELFLMTVFMAGRIGVPSMGLMGYGPANALAPLFGLLLLGVATRLHKKKQG